MPFWGPLGPLVTNIVTIDLTAPGVRLVPVRAAAPTFLQPLDQMVASDGRKGLLAGINAGYFWRTDVSSFWDSVCQGKLRADALQPASPGHPNWGVGDAAMVVDGATLSSNCNCTGFSRPAVLSIDGPKSRIDVLHRGDPPPAGVSLDAIAAGPNLVSTSANGTVIDIPKDDDNLGNILEHAANTMVAFRDNLAFFVTFDGFDGCSFFDPTCGTNAFSMAYFARDFLKATSAMGMDQGGSTTMFVRGQGANGIVSHSGGGARPVFNGLFVLVE